MKLQNKFENGTSFNGLGLKIKSHLLHLISYLSTLAILSFVFAGCDNSDGTDNYYNQYDIIYPAPDPGPSLTGMDGGVYVQFSRIDTAIRYELYYGSKLPPRSLPEDEDNWNDEEILAVVDNPFNPIIIRQPESKLVDAEIPNLTNYIPWYVWARVLYADAYSKMSVCGSATPRPKPAGPPEDFVPYSDDGAVGITWAPVTDADSYMVYYDTAAIPDPPSSSSTVKKAPFSGDPECDVMALVTGLANGTTYNIRMSAVNTSGETALSSVQTVKPAVNTTKPVEPDGISCTAGSSSITVRWKPVKYAKKYKIFYKQSSAPVDSGDHSGEQSIEFDAGAGRQTQKIPDLENGKSCYFWIKAVNGEYESDYSQYGNTTPKTKPPLNMNTFTMKIGEAAASFPEAEAGKGDRLSRKQETTMGDLTADSLVYWARKHKGDYSYDDVDFAIFNGGVILSAIGPGSLTVGYIRTKYYQDEMSYITLTGAQVRTLFEGRVATVPHTGGGGTGTGAFAQVSKEVRFTLNYHGTKQDGTIDKLEISKGGVMHNLLDGTHDSEQYRIITSTYLLTGGDGYTAYLMVGTAQKDTHKIIAEATCDYIYDQDNVPIEPYTDGRITLVGELWQ